jgi:hypothetical protein
MWEVLFRHVKVIAGHPIEAASAESDFTHPSADIFSQARGSKLQLNSIYGGNLYDTRVICIMKLEYLNI